MYDKKSTSFSKAVFYGGFWYKIEKEITGRHKITPRNIRLTPFEIEMIRTSFQKFFPPLDHLWIFGSRTNSHAQGGDIDLYIETTMDASAAVEQETAFVIDLYGKIGEQKIDTVLNLMTNPYPLAIYEVATEEGVQLV